MSVEMIVPFEMPGLQISSISPSDVVIAIMGITGSGKSTFISLLVENGLVHQPKIGHSLTSCTADVQIHSFIYKNTRKVFLIDTPGFDDTNRTDTDVLKDVAFFLSQTYKQTVQLSGIIYLHRITDDRMAGSSLRNLSMFKKLCGDDAYKHVVLATTMWGNLSGPNLSFDTGVKRETELLSRKDWWGLMCERGSTVFRHTGEDESALKIIGSLIERCNQDGPVLLSIQKEMVDDKKSLEDTAAGQEVEKELHETKRRFQEHIEDLQQSYEQALKDRDEQLADTLLQQREELEVKLKKASEAQESLKVSLDKLTEEKAREYEQLLLKFQEEQNRTDSLKVSLEAECARLEWQREEDAARHVEQQTLWEKQRKESDARVEEMIQKRDYEEAERAKKERSRIEESHKILEGQFAAQLKQQEQQAQALQVQIEEWRKTKQKRDHSSLGIMAALVGGMMLNPGGVITGLAGNLLSDFTGSMIS